MPLHGFAPPYGRSPKAPPGEFGSLSFDGTSTYCLYPSAGGIFGTHTNCSLFAWIRTLPSGSGGSIYCERSSGLGIWKLETSGAAFQFTHRDDSGSLQQLNASTISVNDGNWHHVGITKAGTVLARYVDGVLQSSNTIGTDSLANLLTGIGFDPFDSGAYFAGNIGGVKGWTIALSPDEVLRAYRARPASARGGLNTIAKSLAQFGGPLGFQVGYGPMGGPAVTSYGGLNTDPLGYGAVASAAVGGYQATATGYAGTIGYAAAASAASASYATLAGSGQAPGVIDYWPVTKSQWGSPVLYDQAVGGRRPMTLHGFVAGYGYATGPEGSKGSISFDGNGYLQFGASGGIVAALPTFSIAAWVNTTNPSAGCVYSERAPGAGANTLIHVEPDLLGIGKVLVIFHTDGGQTQEILGSIPVSDGLWHRIALSVDLKTTQTWSLYVDGELDLLEGWNFSGYSNLTTRIGGDAYDSLAGFRGGIEGVKLWNVAIGPLDVLRDALLIPPIGGLAPRSPAALALLPPIAAGTVSYGAVSGSAVGAYQSTTAAVNTNLLMYGAAAGPALASYGLLYVPIPGALAYQVTAQAAVASYGGLWSLGTPPNTSVYGAVAGSAVASYFALDSPGRLVSYGGAAGAALAIYGLSTHTPLILGEFFSRPAPIGTDPFGIDYDTNALLN